MAVAAVGAALAAWAVGCGTSTADAEARGAAQISPRANPLQKQKKPKKKPKRPKKKPVETMPEPKPEATKQDTRAAKSTNDEPASGSTRKSKYHFALAHSVSLLSGYRDRRNLCARAVDALHLANQLELRVRDNSISEVLEKIPGKPLLVRASSGGGLDSAEPDLSRTIKLSQAETQEAKLLLGRAQEELMELRVSLESCKKHCSVVEQAYTEAKKTSYELEQQLDGKHSLLQSEAQAAATAVVVTTDNAAQTVLHEQAEKEVMEREGKETAVSELRAKIADLGQANAAQAKELNDLKRHDPTAVAITMASVPSSPPPPKERLHDAKLKGKKVQLGIGGTGLQVFDRSGECAIIICLHETAVCCPSHSILSFPSCAAIMIVPACQWSTLSSPRNNHVVVAKSDDAMRRAQSS